jgi:DNA-binding MurR/RpiR family transcriptional regulator
VSDLPGEPTTGSEIERRIRDAYDDLSPSGQRVAEFLLRHRADLAVYSATEVADASGVSKATVSRLFRTLGYADAQEVRDEARALRSRGVPVAVGPRADLAEHVAAEHAALDLMVAGLSDGRLDRAAEAIAGAREVVVAGFRNSYPVALHLRQQLAQARGSVRIAPAPGQSVGEELAGLGASDVAVLVGFRRRPRGFGDVVMALVARGVPVVVLADPEFHAPDVLVLEAPLEGVSPFDSYASAMSLANLLAAAVLGLDPVRARERVAEVTALYDELGELEPG